MYRAPRCILYFKGCIARRDRYNIYRGMYMRHDEYYYRGTCRDRDICMDKYIFHGFGTERQRVCIIRLNMHHYIWHNISLYCTSLLLVNLILCVVDLMSTYLWNLWQMNIESVFEDIQLFEYCCWGYENVIIVGYALCKLWTVRLS